MTEQVPDIILIAGEEYAIRANPLENWFEKDNPRPDFQYPNTECVRGYVAKWQINRKWLFLLAINGQDKLGEAIGLSTVFPGMLNPIEAYWFTGILRITEVDMKTYVPRPYGSTFEHDRIIYIRAGKVMQDIIWSSKNGHQFKLLNQI